MSDPQLWRWIQLRAMEADFSWSGPARDYVASYRRAADARR